MKKVKDTLTEDLFGAPPPVEAPADPLLEGLNAAQADAVRFGEGPLLIVAGAGTGKTTVLTRRIAHLITSKRAFPNEILALTFTDKAANEMEDRVDRLVPYGFNDVCISTFHSFGDKVLREFAFEIGLSPDLRVMTQPEAIVFVRQNLFKFELKHYLPLSDPTKFVESLLTVFSRAKDEDVTPQQFIDFAQKKLAEAESDDDREAAEKNLEVARAYQTYEQLKTQAGAIDFGDQVVLALRIFREKPSVLKKFQERFKYILVDEFQDTNYTQFECVKLLAAGRQNITVVGDDDQSIYKFRGACLSNILGFRKAYPDAHEIVLIENYRSTQEILDAAYRCIQHNNPDRLEYIDRLSKSLRSQKGSGLGVRHQHFETQFQQCEAVVDEIKQRVEAKSNEPKDFAILVRTNSSAEPFMKSLNLAGIPWRFSGNAGLYEQEEIRIALAFLRALAEPDDSASLFYLAVSNHYQLDAEDAAALSQTSHRTRRPLYDIFRLVLGGTGEEPKKLSIPDEDLSALSISPESKKIIGRLVDDVVKYRKLSTKMPTGNVLYQYFEESGVLKRLADSNDLRSVQEAQNLHKFFEIIKKFGQVSLYDRVNYFVQYVEALRLAGEDPASAEASFEDNAVNILTVHAAKGLEFPIVFLAGLEQGHFPITSRGESVGLPDDLVRDILPTGDAHIQEERRLFYVGLTRAKDELILCSARDMGKKKIWKPSQFLTEALDKPQAAASVVRAKPLDSLKIFAPAPPAPQTANAASATPRSKDDVLYLQATAVQEYLDCPQKYKFSRVMKIPVLPHHTTVFGIAVHAALQAFNVMLRDGKVMELEAMLQAYRSNWSSVGFISREHEEKRFQEGLRLLKSYHKAESASGRIPTHVEEDFRLSLDGARLRGRIDRMDVHPDASTIVDYKTGEVKDQKDADKKAKESVQLSLYALAFRERFNKLPNKTVLYFVKSGLIGEAVPTEEKVAKTLETAEQVIQGINAQQFPATPGYLCRWCAYEKICSQAQR